MSAGTGQEGQSAQGPSDDGTLYRVDTRGSEGVLVGDQGTQINYFYRGTWTDGVAPVPLVSVAGTITSPYRGLSPFGERDAGLFFGRESAATEVLELMSRRLEGPGLVVVSGVSGAGKSSLLRAGVLPRLRRRGPRVRAGGGIVAVPGVHPRTRASAGAGGPGGAGGGRGRRRSTGRTAGRPTGFALTVPAGRLGPPGRHRAGWRRARRAGQRRVLLVVDQFEQLFTQCQNEDGTAGVHHRAARGRRQPRAATSSVPRLS